MTGTGIITKYFPQLNEDQIEKYRRLNSLYSDWNKKINLISRKDMDALYVKHVLHSLSISRFIEFMPGTVILDAGTGGGFPGIPLAIYFPGSQFLLVDSIGKKVNVVVQIAEELQLENVETRKERIEHIQEKFDYIVSRAVTRLSTLYRWTKDNIRDDNRNRKENGIICLKGGDLSDEIKEVGQYTEIIDINKFFSEPFFESKKIIFIPNR